MQHKNTGLRRIILAARYSWQGLVAAYQSEAAFRQELLACALLLPIACWVEATPAERALLVASLFIVLIVELLNSAIEALVDRVGTEHHELSGKAKDIGSAAVFMALMLVAVVWSIVLLG